MPYCPRCFQEREEDLARCPLDRSFYVESRCERCLGEVFPREDFCGGCGHRLQGRKRDARIELSPASAGRRTLALALDALVLLLFGELLAGWLPAAWILPALSLGVLTYYVALQSAGRQTMGQLVLGTIVLDPELRPLAWQGALKRTLFAPLFGPAERWSGAREWRAPEV